MNSTVGKRAAYITAAAMADLVLRKSTMTEKGIKDAVTETWTPPTVSAGKVPQVIPGRSNNQDIEGDFPLDQIVIDRK